MMSEGKVLVAKVALVLKKVGKGCLRGLYKTWMDAKYSNIVTG